MSAAVPVRVGVQLAAGQRQRVGHLVGSAAEERPVDTAQQSAELAFVRRGDHEDATAFGGREGAVVEVIAIQGDERAPQLLGEPGIYFAIIIAFVFVIVVYI